MNLIISNEYAHYRSKIIAVIKNFKNEGTLIGSDRRNAVKHLKVEDLAINIKSFKQPNIVNRNVYKYFRKSKARRSFENAQLLINSNLYTPKPIAYLENYNIFGLTSSYYICEHLQGVFTFGDVLRDPLFVDRKTIIDDYASLMFQLHENGIEFLDNNSTNFLIKKEEGSYRFYLVDLNRINLHKNMDVSKRLSNFARLTDDLQILEAIGVKYASLSGIPLAECTKKIIDASRQHHFRYMLKRKLKFYKSLKFKRS